MSRLVGIPLGVCLPMKILLKHILKVPFACLLGMWLTCSFFPGDLACLSRRSSLPFISQSEAIGVKTYEYFDSVRKRPVLVELWYPISQEGPLEETQDAIWVYPKEVRNAQFLEGGGKRPLILMSHGHGGDRRDRSWLAEKLVQKGYIVASVEHFGNTRHYRDALLSLRFWERPLDVSFALNELLKDQELLQLVDPSKVGFIGYSLGGMTGLCLAGAIPQNVKETFARFKKSVPEIQDDFLHSCDFREAERSFKDNRIRSFLLLCPAVFVFPPDSLQKVKAPVGLVATTSDTVLPHEEHAYQLMKWIVPKKLIVLAGEASHYSFLNRISKKGESLIKGPYRDAPGSNREKIHDRTALFADEFFRDTLY